MREPDEDDVTHFVVGAIYFSRLSANKRHSSIRRNFVVIKIIRGSFRELRRRLWSDRQDALDVIFDSWACVSCDHTKIFIKRMGF